MLPSTNVVEGPALAPPAGEGAAGLELRHYLHVIGKRKWLILSVFLVVLGAMAIWTFSQEKIFRVTATVLVDRQAPQVLGKEVGEVVDLSTGASWYSKEYMETQLRVLTSKSLAQAVIAQLNLTQNARLWRDSWRKPMPPTEADTVALLQKMVGAQVVRDSQIIEISVEHADPALGVQIANAYAEAYLDQHVGFRLASTTGAAKWLADQLDDLKAKLDAAELALYSFKKTHQLVSVSLVSGQNLLLRRIEKLNDALTDVRIRRMEVDALRTQVNAAGQSDALDVAAGPVIEDESIRRLKDTYIQEHRKTVALQQKYLDEHPLVQEQRAVTAFARQALEREINNVVRSVEERFAATRENEQKLAAALQRATTEALELNRREMEYNQLERTRENIEKLYALVLNRLKESDLSAQLRVNNIRLLDRAVVPKVPVKPRVPLNLAMGALLGLILGTMLGFVIESLDTTVTSSQDLSEIPGLLFLGTIPHVPGVTGRRSAKGEPRCDDTDLLVHRAPKSSFAESCRAIRTSLLFTSPDQPLRRIVVTSPGPQEGKTTSAISIAITMAQSGSNVLLLDTDMRRPRLHNVFAVPGREGLTSVLLGNGSLEALLRCTDVPNLSLLPCGPIPPNPAELCQSERFRALLGQLSERYDRIILDSPPITAVTDAIILSTIADGTLIVVRANETSRVALRDSCRQVQDVGGRLLGCILNDVDIQAGRYGYSRLRRYGYRYHRYSYAYGASNDGSEQV